LYIPNLIVLNVKEIKEQYSEENLKIIFITQDSNLTAFSNAVVKHKIDFGIHIFSTPDLIDLYGAQAIPKIFLIDTNGVIIYNSQIEKDSHLDVLKELLKEKIK
jgi:thioredoxin-related protein